MRDLSRGRLPPETSTCSSVVDGDRAAQSSVVGFLFFWNSRDRLNSNLITNIELGRKYTTVTFLTKVLLIHVIGLVYQGSSSSCCCYNFLFNFAAALKKENEKVFFLA